MKDAALVASFSLLEGLVRDVRRIVDIAQWMSEGRPLDAYDQRWLQAVAYKSLPDAEFVCSRLVGAVLMREAAREARSFTWYCSAQYLLSGDWGAVVESVPWEGWGCSEQDPALRFLCVFVAAHGFVSREDSRIAMSGVALSPEGLIDAGIRAGLVRKYKSAHLVLGAQAPRMT